MGNKMDLENKMELENIEKQVYSLVVQLMEKHSLRKGDIFVVGCSSSEISGGNIGKNSNADVGKAVFAGASQACAEKDVFLACQCCEHLNRALVVERECADKYGYEEVLFFYSNLAGSASRVCQVMDG